MRWCWLPGGAEQESVRSRQVSLAPAQIQIPNLALVSLDVNGGTRLWGPGKPPGPWAWAQTTILVPGSCNTLLCPALQAPLGTWAEVWCEGQSSVPVWALSWFVYRNALVSSWLWAQQIVNNDKLIRIVVMQTRFSPGQLLSWLQLIKAFDTFSPWERGLCKHTGGRDPGGSQPRRRQNDNFVWSRTSLKSFSSLRQPQASSIPLSHIPGSKSAECSSSEVATGGLLLRLNYATIIFYKMHHKTYSCFILAWKSYSSLAGCRMPTLRNCLNLYFSWSSASQPHRLLMNIS